MADKMVLKAGTAAIGGTFCVRVSDTKVLAFNRTKGTPVPPEYQHLMEGYLNTECLQWSNVDLTDEQKQALLQSNDIPLSGPAAMIDKPSKTPRPPSAPKPAETK